MNVEEIVFSKVAEAKGLDQSTLSRESTFLELGLDSLDMIEFSMDIEDVFGMTINQQDMVEIKTLGQAIDMIEKKKNG